MAGPAEDRPTARTPRGRGGRSPAGPTRHPSGTSPRSGRSGSAPSSRGAARSSGSRPASSRPASTRPTTRQVGRSGTPADPRLDRTEVAAGRGGQWRWVVIGVVALVLAVLVAPTVRSYLQQRSEIRALSAQVATQRADVAALEAEQQRWRDPDYVEAQARERLKFVRVGETMYTVIDDTGSGVDPRNGRSGDATGPWYGYLWESLTAADRPSAGSQ